MAILNQESTYQGQLLLDESLTNYTTWRVGGKAKKLYKPTDVYDLRIFLMRIPSDEPILWLGLGSNSLIRDQGFTGTVILTQGQLHGLQLLNDNEVRVEAGVSCAKMARFCARNNLADAEFWAGIPGTMGGALRMNAGCFNGETWRFVVEVETITRKGELRRRTPDEFAITYRHVSGLDADEWFVAARFRFSQGDKAESLKKIHELLDHRAKTQPTNEANCGSVFRNPPAQFAAKLIEECGLKGKRLGGAMVSERHANFIINDQNSASANDIESLIQLVQKTVFEQTAVELIREVHILGE